MTDVSCLTLVNQDSLENVNHMIPQSWLLLDTCTTRSMSNNKSIVNDITDGKCNSWLKLHNNGGPVIFNEMVKLNLLPLTVHFNEAYKVTIISFSDVCDINGIRVILTRSWEYMLMSSYPLAKLSVSNILTQSSFVLVHLLNRLLLIICLNLNIQLMSISIFKLSQMKNLFIRIKI